MTTTTTSAPDNTMYDGRYHILYALDNPIGKIATLMTYQHDHNSYVIEERDNEKMKRCPICNKPVLVMVKGKLCDDCIKKKAKKGKISIPPNELPNP